MNYTIVKKNSKTLVDKAAEYTHIESLNQHNVVVPMVADAANKSMVNQHNNILTDKGYLIVNYDSEFHIYNIFEVSDVHINDVPLIHTNVHHGLYYGLENTCVLTLNKYEIATNTYMYFMNPIYLGKEDGLFVYRCPLTIFEYVDVDNKTHISDRCREDGYFLTKTKIKYITGFGVESKNSFLIKPYESASTAKNFTFGDTSRTVYIECRITENGIKYSAIEPTSNVPVVILADTTNRTDLFYSLTGKIPMISVIGRSNGPDTILLEVA